MLLFVPLPLHHRRPPCNRSQHQRCRFRHLGMIFPSFEVEEVFLERFSGFGVGAFICDVGIFFVAGALVVLTEGAKGIMGIDN